MLFLRLNNIITFSYEIVFSLRNVQVTLIPCFLCIPTMSLYLITFLFNKLFISFCSTLLPYIIRACFFCWSLLIEPWAANVFTEQSAKGTFIRKNKELKKVFRKIGIDTKETWDQILADGGSVQGIKQLDGWFYDHTGRLNQEQGESVKNVFKTFKEINQLELVRQAGIRQDYIDQSVSLNLAFPSEAPPRWLNQVHIEAWKRGIKTLYYTRTESVLRGDIAAAAMDPDCLSCDG